MSLRSWLLGDTGGSVDSDGRDEDSHPEYRTVEKTREWRLDTFEVTVTYPGGHTREFTCNRVDESGDHRVRLLDVELTGSYITGRGFSRWDYEETTQTILFDRSVSSIEIEHVDETVWAFDYEERQKWLSNIEMWNHDDTVSVGEPYLQHDGGDDGE